MIIDVHVHILPPEVIHEVEHYRERDEYFALLHKDPKSRFATAETIIEEMNNSGVGKSVVFGFAFKDMGICRMLNDYIMESVKRYPDRLIGFGVVNPMDGKVEKEVLRCKEGGLRGIGELFPDGQGFDVGNPDEMHKFTSICKELDMVVSIHSNEPVGHYYEGKDSTHPEKAYRFALANPELNIIFAHWGGGLFFYELMPEVRRALKRVFYDTAASPYLYSKEIYNVAKAVGIVEKVLMGTDFPLIGPKRYIKEISSTELSEGERGKILGGNAEKLFGV